MAVKAMQGLHFVPILSKKKLNQKLLVSLLTASQCGTVEAAERDKHSTEDRQMLSGPSWRRSPIPDAEEPKIS